MTLASDTNTAFAAKKPIKERVTLEFFKYLLIFEDFWL